MNGNFGNRNRDGPFRPVRVGEIVNVEVEGVGEKGDGICRKKGFVIFVPNTKKGDKVKVKVTKVFQKVGFGEVIDVLGEDAEVESNEPPAKRSAGPSYIEDTPKDSEGLPEDSEEFGEAQSQATEDFGEEDSDLDDSADEDDSDLDDSDEPKKAADSPDDQEVPDDEDLDDSDEELDEDSVEEESLEDEPEEEKR